MTFCVESEEVRILYLMAPQWQLASYQILAGASGLDMVWDLWDLGGMENRCWGFGLYSKLKIDER